MNAALQRLEEEINGFKACLADFDLAAEKPSEQQRFSFTDVTVTESSPQTKAA